MNNDIYTMDPVEAATYAEQQKALIEKKQLRANIAEYSGDTLSLLGSTADLAQLLLVELAQLTTALSNAKTLAEVRSAVEPVNAALAPTMERLQNGNTLFPYQVKNGTQAVLPDIESKATEIAKLIQESKAPA